MGIRLQHGEMNIVYMGQRYYEDFFFCLVAQLIVHDVLSNLGFGGLIFQTCSSRNPPPLFYHLCSSFSNSSSFSSFSPCWLYSGFCVPFSFASMVQLMIVAWHGQRWSYQFSIPKADCLFLFFFHLETPKTYIWRLVFIISFAVVYNQSSACFTLSASRSLCLRIQLIFASSILPLSAGHRALPPSIVNNVFQQLLSVHCNLSLCRNRFLTLC